MASLSRVAATAMAAVLAASPVMAAPRAVGLRPAPATPEAGLWDVSEKAERLARQSAELNADAALNAYVGGVACKVAADYCPELRVYILDRPFMNAAVAPNGYVEVWSGLLLRADSEAELAYVLGHEVSHYAENHSLRAHEALKGRASAALILSAGIGLAGMAASAGAASSGAYNSASSISDATSGLINVVYLGTMASLFGFSREQEQDADLLGLRRATAAGYPATAGPAIWRSHLGETAASDFEKVRKSESRASIFASHPLSAARIAALDTEAAKLPVAAGDAGRDRHRAAIRPFLGRWLKDDLRRRDYGETLHILDRLAVGGQDLGVINFYRGEAYRLRRKDGDQIKAVEAYAQAVALPDAPVAAWRELGDLRRRANDAAGARAAYQTYLDKAPAADDAWIVKDALQALPQGS